ncbi:MAG: sugar transferase [Gammaproteobacteria bacterium]|nr:sugar transferase [Gammaproteobacteria bacterium]
MTVEKFSSDFLDAEPVTISGRSVGRLFRLCKRAADFAVALFLLPGLMFCALLLLVLNRFFNPGPMLFKQQRVGRDKTLFQIYKFRTMEGRSDDPRFAPQETDRINQLGAFMRRTRIDELPQILNVLMGDMSIVGPRPEQVSFYQVFEAGIPGFARRQVVRPGITGLAQLKYGYTSDEAGTARKLKWDLKYIDRMGFRIEAYIMAQTFLFVMGRLLKLGGNSKL